MKLVDLHPRWFAEPGRHGQGLTFDCPHCQGGPKSVRLAVPFVLPLDRGAAVPLDHKILWPLLWPRPDEPEGQVTVPPGCHWARTGETFDVLTLTPSVDASASGHWHGHVKQGVCI